MTLGNLWAFVCYASIIVNDKLHTSIVTIKSFQLGAVFVECIVRCEQLSIKLLDEESPASSSVHHLWWLKLASSSFSLLHMEVHFIKALKKSDLRESFLSSQRQRLTVWIILLELDLYYWLYNTNLNLWSFE